MFKTDSPGTPFCAAAAIRRTTPGPKSMRYGVPLTTIAVAGPERSGSGLGVPVPRSTMRVFDVESRCVRALTCSDTMQHVATVQRPIRHCLVNMNRLAPSNAGFVAHTIPAPLESKRPGPAEFGAGRFVDSIREAVRLKVVGALCRVLVLRARLGGWVSIRCAC